MIAWALIALVGLSALPNGSTAPWAWSCAAATASLLLIAAVFVNSARQLRFGPIAPTILSVAIVALWITVQIVAPPPTGLIETLWTRAADGLSTELHPTISIDAAASLDGLIRLLTYCAVFTITFCLAQSHRIATSLLQGVVAVVCLVVIGGTIFEAARPNLISHNGVSGFLPDRNIFATYAGLGLLSSIALLTRPKLRADDLSGSRNSRLRAILSFYIARAWPSLIAIAIMLFGIAQSESRAGLAAAGVGLMVLIVSVRKGSHPAQSSRMGLKISTILAVAVLALTISGTVNRLPLSGNAASERADIYRSIYDGIQTAPLTGFGYGTFAQGFELFRSDVLPRAFKHGHNLFLENAFELGVPAAILLVCAVLWLTVPMVRRLQLRPQDGALPALGLSSIALTGIHSMLDATLRTPALAMLFAVILGLAAGSSLASRKRAESGRAVRH
tara:strand:+ start:1131 stop:2471 length:1341 start_codon:yes stop_codon:yes gene_type:complete